MHLAALILKHKLQNNLSSNHLLANANKIIIEQ
jgi:hypothetical protein